MGEPITRDDLRIVFDGPPGPTSGRFVEVENERGESISVGEWEQDGDLWVLRIPGHLAWLREKVNPTCPDCEGSGHDRRWKGYTPCSRCDGRGYLGVDLDRVREVLEFSSMADLDTPIYQAARALLDLLGEEE